MKPTLWHKHPGVRTDGDLTIGERAADRAIKAMGSWPFLAFQTVFTVAWMTLNVVAWCHHWDPVPWIMLNLIFSIQAAYAAPLMLLAGRRDDQRSSERAQHDLEVDCESLQLLKDIHAHITPKEPT